MLYSMLNSRAVACGHSNLPRLKCVVYEFAAWSVSLSNCVRMLKNITSKMHAVDSVTFRNRRDKD